MHIYRSPYRPLDMGFLPPEVRASWSYDDSDIGEWTPQTRYAFALPIPLQFVNQWSLIQICYSCDHDVASDAVVCRNCGTARADTNYRCAECGAALDHQQATGPGLCERCGEANYR